MRGWSQRQMQMLREMRVVPAHVGLVPCGRRLPCRSSSAPRTRGVDPWRQSGPGRLGSCSPRPPRASSPLPLTTSWPQTPRDTALRPLAGLHIAGIFLWSARYSKRNCKLLPHVHVLSALTAMASPVPRPTARNRAHGARFNARVDRTVGTCAGWSLKIWSRPAMHRFDRAHDSARRASRTTAGTEVRHHA